MSKISDEKRLLPDMPERLHVKGVRSLCYAVMLRALRDAKKPDRYISAHDFACGSWCVNICETFDFDYKSYRDEVLKRCAQTAAAAPSVPPPPRKRGRKPKSGCKGCRDDV